MAKSRIVSFALVAGLGLVSGLAPMGALGPSATVVAAAEPAKTADVPPTNEAPAGTDPTQSAAVPTVVPPVRKLPGMQRDGNILLPNQWSLRPAGDQIPLGDFPENIALHPSQGWAAVLHAGYGEHEIVIVDLKKNAVASRVTLPQTFYGVTFDPAGKRLFASGAERAVIYQFAFADGFLAERSEIAIGDPADKRFVPAGLTCSGDGTKLFVANAWGDTVAIVTLETRAVTHVALEKDTFPYLALPSADGKRLFVSLWNGEGVAILDLATLQPTDRWKTPSHPTEMVLSPNGDTLYVACANSNSVAVFDTATGHPLETISSALHPRAPLGSTPNSVALSSDGKALFIANADNNNVAVFNVSERGKSNSLGFIPVGWYPTSVRCGAIDGRLYVANGKGLLPLANRQGPNPLAPRVGGKTVQQYIGGLLRGTLSVIASPSPEDMVRYTHRAYECSPIAADQAPTAKPEVGNPIPAKLGEPSPIKHCIYIIKENRTYDQVFGDIPAGNGDADLCLFPERVTPNHHAIVEQFVLLDNFYVESEVSADGHEWSMAAYATDFVEKTWPLNYRDGGRGLFRYPSEGAFPIAWSGAGYIWDRCKQRNVSYRSYGEFIRNGVNPGDPGVASVAGLEGHFDPEFRSYDLDYPDVKRAERFIHELAAFEKAGDLPQFIVMRLPNDHTAGTRAGKPTPTAMIAENDVALGLVMAAITRSKFWPETAVFVVEDDAQNGSDHVDAHRTVALVASPYVKRHSVDSHMYSTSSMLRTMELILNLEPMTQFDAAALPMYASFQAERDLSPYDARPARVDLSAVNRADAWGSQLSETLDFSKEDAVDDLVLNEIIWKAVRGPQTSPPPPVRASFVFAHVGVDEDDDTDDDDDDDEKQMRGARGVERSRTKPDSDDD